MFLYCINNCQVQRVFCIGSHHNYVPPIAIRKIYYALFYSMMIYGVSVWGGGNLSNICKIDRINRSAINTFICNLQPNTTPPLKFECVYKLNCLAQFHKYKFDTTFEYFL